VDLAGEDAGVEGRGPLEVRPMTSADVAVADRVMRRAFGVHLGLEDPESTFGAVSYTATRFAISPAGSFVAVSGDEVVGSVHATTWGSFGFFGPLTVREDLWDRGVARRLLAPVVEHFDRGGVALSALFTFAQSAKHVALYQRVGYWPQYLTAIMSRPVAPEATSVDARHFSRLDEVDRRDALVECARLTDRVFAGLDLSVEIASAYEHGFGETVIVDDDAGVAAFAVCHVGGGEADAGVCYVKFAAARPGPSARDHFARLLEGVDALARQRGASQVVAGVDTARRGAYRDLLDAGFRAGGQGIRMHRPDDLGYARPDAYVIDDLR
jgi:predicted N-acetyltransferase YhbS